MKKENKKVFKLEVSNQKDIYTINSMGVYDEFEKKGKNGIVK